MDCFYMYMFLRSEINDDLTVICRRIFVQNTHLILSYHRCIHHKGLEFGLPGQWRVLCGHSSTNTFRNATSLHNTCLQFNKANFATDTMCWYQKVYYGLPNYSTNLFYICITRCKVRLVGPVVVVLIIWLIKHIQKYT